MAKFCPGAGRSPRQAHEKSFRRSFRGKNNFNHVFFFPSFSQEVAWNVVESASSPFTSQLCPFTSCLTLAESLNFCFFIGIIIELNKLI